MSVRDLLMAASGQRRTIQFVGANSGSWLGAASGNNTISLTALTGGISSSAAAGDVVLAGYAIASNANRTAQVIATDGTNSYTSIAAVTRNNTSDISLGASYKRLISADTTTTFLPTGAVGSGGCAVVYVFRNVDPDFPMDVTRTTVNANGGQPDPAAITPVTAGSLIVVLGGAAAVTGATFVASYLSSFVTLTQADTYDPMIGIGYVAWTSGAYNPAAWTGGTGNAGDSEAAITMALRPA